MPVSDDRYFIAFKVVITAFVILLVCGCVGGIAGAALFTHQVTREGVAQIRAVRGLSEEAARDAYFREYQINYDGWPYKNAVKHGALFGVFAGFWLDVVFLLVLGYMWMRRSVDAKVNRATIAGKTDVPLPQSQVTAESGDEEIETFEEL